jgi:hypothetical protein
VSYRAGIDFGFGFGATVPAVSCDFVGCDARKEVSRPPVRALPGWTLIREGSQRRDYCPQHRPGDTRKG